MFNPLAYTKSFALLGTAILGITLVPVLATFLVRGRVHREDDNPVMRWARRLYRPALAGALRHKTATILGAALLFLVSLVLVAGAGVLLAPLAAPASLLASLTPREDVHKAADSLVRAQEWMDRSLAPGVGNEFMPPLDEGTLMFMPVTTNSVSLTQAVEIMKKQDEILRGFPEVASVVGKVGRAESPLDPAPINMYETLVELKPPGQWRRGMSKEKLLAEMTQASQLPGVTTIWQQPIRNRIDMLATGIPTQVGVKVSGPDLATLERKAGGDRRRRPPGSGGRGRLRGTDPGHAVPRDRASSAKPRRATGSRVGDVLDVDRDRDRRREPHDDDRGPEPIPGAGPVQPGSCADDVEKLGQHSRSGDGRGPDGAESSRAHGRQVPLAEVARIDIRPGPSMISAENGLLRERVFLNVRGRDVGSFVDEAKRTVEARVDAPARATSFSGRASTSTSSAPATGWRWSSRSASPSSSCCCT